MNQAKQTIELPFPDLHEAELDVWAAQVASAAGGRVRECEVAADQWCWRLTIDQQHALLLYSTMCQAAWLELLERPQVDVTERLKRAGYV
ncbi:DUF3630 domain-containing protein [Idiomarina tyrosinivorans]|uniref:DUF3630 domain-containing protein n=1 Tax=Idiomarina tyrosinivorans TaxID=1445662 RepID=A0A432ZPT5_9GAMM|nr:DUF3630 family protein [Idiomarina tyrosinivorans]RUO79893.1 DUF3630 domain-containing protein [Idiomarina tyrosinivorans]